MSHTDATRLQVLGCAAAASVRCCCAHTHMRLFFNFLFCPMPRWTSNVIESSLQMNAEEERERGRERAHFQCVCWFYFYHLFAFTTAHNKYINVCVIFSFASNYIRPNDFVVWSQKLCYCKKRDKMHLKRATTRAPTEKKRYIWSDFYAIINSNLIRKTIIYAKYTCVCVCVLFQRRHYNLTYICK